eukprot:GFYU01006843.1.p1 GENE.GFYU01006843.1~~GFYU01006843.1.p1  ORF type:complete len:253 (-),score=30.14 GFYU01006843.1:340-1098(-)
MCGPWHNTNALVQQILYSSRHTYCLCDANTIYCVLVASCMCDGSVYTHMYMRGRRPGMMSHTLLLYMCMCVRVYACVILSLIRFQFPFMCSLFHPCSAVEAVGEGYVLKHACDCLIRDFACLLCGNFVGYNVISACYSCLSSSNNGHYWLFHARDVTSEHLRNEDGEVVKWSQLHPIQQQRTSTGGDDTNACMSAHERWTDLEVSTTTSEDGDMSVSSRSSASSSSESRLRGVHSIQRKAVRARMSTPVIQR